MAARGVWVRCGCGRVRIINGESPGSISARGSVGAPSSVGAQSRKGALRPKGERVASTVTPARFGVVGSVARLHHPGDGAVEERIVEREHVSQQVRDRRVGGHRRRQLNAGARGFGPQTKQRRTRVSNALWERRFRSPAICQPARRGPGFRQGQWFRAPISSRSREEPPRLRSAAGEATHLRLRGTPGGAAGCLQAAPAPQRWRRVNYRHAGRAHAGSAAAGRRWAVLWGWSLHAPWRFEPQVSKKRSDSGARSRRRTPAA